MSTWMEGPVITRIAGADLKNQEGKIVTLDAAGRVVLCGANGMAIGVLVEGAAANEAVGVKIAGTARVVAGAAIAVGTLVSSNAAAQAVPAPGAVGTPPSFRGEFRYTLGIALTAASAGELVEVQISPGCYMR